MGSLFHLPSGRFDSRQAPSPPLGERRFCYFLSKGATPEPILGDQAPFHLPSGRFVFSSPRAPCPNQKWEVKPRSISQAAVYIPKRLLASLRRGIFELVPPGRHPQARLISPPHTQIKINKYTFLYICIYLYIHIYIYIYIKLASIVSSMACWARRHYGRHVMFDVSFLCWS